MNSAIDSVGLTGGSRPHSIKILPCTPHHPSNRTLSLHGGLVRIVQLDGLRGLLALYVATYHLATSLMRPGTTLAMLHPLLDQAWFSVDVFFVMSGFVMMHVYGAVFEHGVKGAETWRFFGARIARLYPVHLFAMLVMAVGIVPFIFQQPDFLDGNGRYSWQSALASLFMLHSPWIDHRTWNYPAWSISAEWHAYLLFPLLAPVIARMTRRSGMTIIMFCLCVPLCVYLFRGMSEDHYPTNGAIVLARVIPLFIAGMALRRLHDTPAITAYRPESNWFACGALIFIGAAFVAPQFPPFAVLAIPLLIWTAISTPALSRFFGCQALLWLGRVSYSLYMTHALVEMFFVNTLLRWSTRYFAVDVVQSWPASIALLLGAIVVSLAIGWATWRWIEVPGRSMINRFMNRATAPVARAAITS